nr:aspartyl-phosphate phosphatase Spo0E family protein [Paenibacillus piscarius]
MIVLSADAHRLSLEAEIQSLRSRMEQLFVQEKSFTSDKVIAISSLLDTKINEYMRGRHRKGE